MLLAYLSYFNFRRLNTVPTELSGHKSLGILIPDIKLLMVSMVVISGYTDILHQLM